MTRQHWWLGITHGVAWKLASLGSKAGFLLVLAPALASGQFAAYIFYSTAALVLGRIGACGLSDQLVLEIRGRGESGCRFHRLYRGLFLTALTLFLAGVASESAWHRSIALSTVLIAGAVLEGVLRSIWPARYEQLLNGPPVLFLVLVSLAPSRSAVDLLAFYGASMLAFQAWLAARSGFWSRSGAVERTPLGELLAMCQRGFAKMIAEMTLILNMRGLILWPKLLGGGLASDSLSLALTIGEAMSTLPMVVVNRNFARYAAAGVATRRVLGGALMVIAGMGIAGLALLAGWDLVPERIASRVAVTDLMWALLLYGAVTAYYDLRYHAWTLTPYTNRFTVWQVAIFLLQGVIVVWFDRDAMLPTFTLVAAGIVLCWIAWSFRVGDLAPRNSDRAI